MQPQKTQADERTIYVSGINCVPELTNESFLATQNLYGHKPDGVRFYHYVQSFSPSENVTPELAHRIALKLASYFGNREVLVATHLDSDHLHSHFVIDSYDIDSGKNLSEKFSLLLEGQQYRNEIKGVILFTVGMLALVSVLCLTILRGLGVI